MTPYAITEAEPAQKTHAKTASSEREPESSGGTLRERVFEAYGGDAWRKATAVEAVVSVNGPGFFLKGRSSFDHAKIRAEIGRPLCHIAPINAAGHVGVFDGADTRTEAPDGTILQKRQDARRFFPGGRRTFTWDDLDQAYFAGYASWNYLVFPALLIRGDIRWTETGPWTLTADFPENLPTHSPHQTFHIDPATNLVRQHDYIAEVFGSKARSGHVILDHKVFDRIPVPVLREARPLFPGGFTIPGVYVIRLRMHEWRLV